MQYYLASGSVRTGFAPSAVEIMVTGPAPDPRASVPASSTPPPTTPSAVVRVSFEGANLVAPVAQGAVAHRSNFFYGSDPSLWQTGVPSFRAVSYPGLYDGIDLTYRANTDGPKYEFTLAPGSDPSRIVLAFEGAGSLGLSPSGDLVVVTAAGEFTDSAPTASQPGGGAPACRFVLASPLHVGFACSGVNPSEPLTIDPLIYSTFLGGQSDESIFGVAANGQGEVYVTGYTSSSTFPTVTGSYDTSLNGGQDVFVSKLSADGTTLNYSTFVGGSSTDYGYAIAVDANGSAYVGGYTYSSTFPTTASAFQRTYSGWSDAFVFKLSADGSSLVYSSFLGGSYYNYVQGIAVDANGSAYATGYTYSSDFPTTPGAYNRTGQNYDAFVTKFSPDGSSLVYSTYLGGESTDLGYAIALDASGYAYVTGYTCSMYFPTTAGAYAASQVSCADAFVTKLNLDGSGLVYSTYLGGMSSEYGYAIAVDVNGSAAVGGMTYSSDFPTSSTGFQRVYNTGASDAFVVKMKPDGSGLAFGSYLGGTNYEEVHGVAYDANGLVLAAGFTASTDFPTAGPAYSTSLKGSYDAFVTRFSFSGRSLEYSTFFGGSNAEYARAMAFDQNGGVYIGGQTYSNDFPLKNAYDVQYQNDEAFVFKLQPRWPIITIAAPEPGIYFTMNGTNFTTPFTFSCEGGSRLIYVPSPQGNNSTHFLFNGWTDGGPQARALNCTADMSLEIKLRTEHNFTLNSTPAGMLATVDGSNVSLPRSFWWALGSNHTLEALPMITVGLSQYNFAGWSDGLAAVHNITVDAPGNVSVSYTAARHQVTVATSPPGLDVIVDGARLRAPQSFWWDIGSEHGVDTVSPQDGTPGQRFQFLSWSDGGLVNHTVTVDQPRVVTALFGDEFVTLFGTAPENLSIVVDGTLLSTPLSLWWVNGSTHTLDIPPAGLEVGPVRYTFTGWSDPNAPKNRTVRADSPYTYVARYAPSAYEAFLDTSPTGLNLTVDGAVTPAPATFWWDAGTPHTVSVSTPQVVGSVRYTYARWDDGGQLTHSLSATEPLHVAAIFSLAFEVVVDTDPTGLDVRIDGQPKTAPQSIWWVNGSSHGIGVATTQGALTDTKYVFASWSDSEAQNHTFTVTSPARLVAAFDAWYHLTLSSDSVIPSCDAPDCWYLAGRTASFSVSSTRALGPGAQSAFVTWSGDSSALTPSATVLMNGPKHIGAVWVTQYYLTVSSPFGTASGEGWYNEGATASVSVAPTEVTGDNVTHKFTGWTGQVRSQDASTTVVVDGARTVAALWEDVAAPSTPTQGETHVAGPDAGGLPILPIIVGAAGAAAGVGLLLVMRRRKHEEEPEAAKPVAPEAVAQRPTTDATITVQVAKPETAGSVGATAAAAVAAPKPPVKPVAPVRAASPPAKAGAPPAKPTAPAKTSAAPIKPAAPVKPAAPAKPAAPPAKPAAPPAKAPPPIGPLTPAAPAQAAAQTPAAPAPPPLCPTCSSPVEVGWLACPECGLDLVWV